MFFLTHRSVINFVAALLLAHMPSSWATIVAGDDSKFSWTIDTSTGLEWLDFDAGPAPTTIGRSYQEVAGQLGPGGDYAGWRFATRAEATHFVLGVTGLPYLIFNGASLQQDGAAAIVANWTGYTELFASGTATNLVLGFTGDPYSSKPLEFGSEGIYYFGLFDNTGGFRTDEYTLAVSAGVNSDEIYSGFGSWLVRGGQRFSAPEPSSFWLVMLGLACVVSRSRLVRTTRDTLPRH